jgi:hypothetical protein
VSGAVSLRFRSGRGPSAGPPPFEGIRGASARAVNGDPCDPNGFDITVQRVIRKAGALVKTESYKTKYDAQDQVICTSG